MGQAVSTVLGLAAVASSSPGLIKRALSTWGLATPLPLVTPDHSIESLDAISGLPFAPAHAVVEGVRGKLALEQLGHLRVREILAVAVLVDHLGVGGLDFQQALGGVMLAIVAHEHKRVDEFLIHLEVYLLTDQIHVSGGHKGQEDGDQFLGRYERIGL